MSMMPVNHLIFCRPLLLPSIFPSIRVFSNKSALHIRWPKYWSFSFSISPSNEYSGLISFRVGWFDLLAVQGTLESLLQHHSPKTSILHCSAFFMVQLSHLYMTTVFFFLFLHNLSHMVNLYSFHLWTFFFFFLPWLDHYLSLTMDSTFKKFVCVAYKALGQLL